MKDEYTIDINRRDVEFRQVRETLHLVTNQLVEADHERANQHAKIKDMEAELEQCRLDLRNRDAQIAELTPELDALRYRNDELHTEIGRLTNRKVEELHAKINDLTGEVETLNMDLDCLRNLRETDQKRFQECQEAMQRKIAEAWQLERRLDTLRDVFRDTVHVLIEKL